MLPFGNVIVKLPLTFQACLLGLVACLGCSSDEKGDVSLKRLKSMAGGELKEVFPVNGVVKVDGNPTEGVNLYLFREDELSSPISECRTDKDGKFCWTTTLSCDGLPPGKYKLGFSYIPKPKKNGTGEDLFKGKYRNPKKNDFPLNIDLGAPQENLEYDLKLK